MWWPSIAFSSKSSSSLFNHGHQQHHEHNRFHFQLPRLSASSSSSSSFSPPILPHLSRHHWIQRVLHWQPVGQSVCTWELGFAKQHLHKPHTDSIITAFFGQHIFQGKPTPINNCCNASPRKMTSNHHGGCCCAFVVAPAVFTCYECVHRNAPKPRILPKLTISFVEEQTSYSQCQSFMQKSWIAASERLPPKSFSAITCSSIDCSAASFSTCAKITKWIEMGFSTMANGNENSKNQTKSTTWKCLPHMFRRWCLWISRCMRWTSSVVGASAPYIRHKAWCACTHGPCHERKAVKHYFPPTCSQHVLQNTFCMLRPRSKT